MIRFVAILLVSTTLIGVDSQLGLGLWGRNNEPKNNPKPNGLTVSLGLPTLLGNNNNKNNNGKPNNNKNDLLNLNKNKNKGDVPCEDSSTTYNGSPVCKGAVIFEDTFQTGVNESSWTIEQYIPTYSGEGGHNYEFVAYRNSPSNVYVLNKVLHVKPIPTTDLQQLRGTLDLTDGCTSNDMSSCTFTAMAGFILPPVTSGKIRTRSLFRYGRIDVDAKLPRGDWIYPIINLSSSKNPNVSVVVAYARGNDYLAGPNNVEIGSRVLYGGAVVHPLEPERSKEWKSYQSSEPFNSERRTFSAVWQSDRIVSYVDGVEYATTYTKSYPEFNESEFFLTIGVAVGGINDFPDESVSSGRTKPWGNTSRRNLREFVDSANDWVGTWTKDQEILKVYSVKITAL